MSSIQRSLENEYVLEHIFGLLNLQEIKACRLVNRMWAKVGNGILRKKSVVRFDFTDTQDDLLKILEIGVMHDSYDTTNDSPFSSFSFRGSFNLAYLGILILKMGCSMKELAISCFSSYHLITTRRFDLDAMLGDHLEKFHCQILSEGTTFHLSIDQIRFVQDLHLNHCEVNVSDGLQKLRLQRIDLGSKIKYSRNGEILDRFVINDLFDLRKTSFIKLIGKNMILDLAQCPNSNIKKMEVFLEDVIVINWKMCNWKVEELHLSGVPFVEQNLMEIISFTLRKTTVDFSAVHKPLKICRLYCLEAVEILDAKFFFPNATRLCLIDQSIIGLHNFAANENLEEVYMTYSGNEEDDAYRNSPEIRIQDFPKYIKRLILVNVRIEGSGLCSTEALQLYDYYHFQSFDECRRIINYFTGEVLSVFMSLNSEGDKDIVPFIKAPKAFKSFVLGNFDWGTEDNFNKTEFSKYVDKQSDCYIFEGPKGISMNPFEPEAFFRYVFSTV